MKVLMLPHANQKQAESGIRRVVEAYFRHLPDLGVELVGPDATSYDLKAVHVDGDGADVLHNHGLYWSADYRADAWEWEVNARVIDTIRRAKEITVPSNWVAETFKRDLRYSPHVIPHGIEWDEWQHSEENRGYVLWNKNRQSDVCDPSPVADLARRFGNVVFVTTQEPEGAPGNVQTCGVLPHDQMKGIVQRAGVYLANVKETGGIGILEAMASGVPVLGCAHGAILDLVEHGVSGYLARPGDLDELAEGLDYCLRYRDVLGANGREAARAFTWRKACEKVAAVYEAALEDEPPTVAIVIPSYNYSGKVVRAIESAISQSYNRITDIVVVDDGSDDKGATERIVRDAIHRNSRIHYIRQNNRGVALARNRGIGEVDCKYVACLDADDAIEPQFIEVCVDALERERSLGIAYTGLKLVKPKGEEVVSHWPGAFDYDQQLRRRNQVPTCCVFRRKMWERLGGYRQRYAPEGAGAEDAEFWLRAGAYGFNAAKVTEEPLFIFSGSGRVTTAARAKQYSEADWLSWHPWTRDGEHPFASVATPKHFSHPVRAYDEPLVSVVIPVGPGHEETVVNALDSLEAQTFRKWEVVVVWDTGTIPNDVLVAYPYIRSVFVTDVGMEPKGAGYARNAGAKMARGDFLLFLDADDWLHPDCLEKMLQAWNRYEAGIYTDYVGLAEIENKDKLALDLRNRIRGKASGKLTVIGYEAQDYDCEKAQRQPMVTEDGVLKPYIWSLITCLVPKLWHEEIGGFDETMQTWEDWDYWLRMARVGKCFVRIPEELVAYRFYTGTRRLEGNSLQIRRNMVEYMANKYSTEGAVSPCTGCGKRRGNPTPRPPMRYATTKEPNISMADEDFLLCEYFSRNAGDHKVYGSYRFESRPPMEHIREGNGFKIFYGQKASGDRFLVHRKDVALAPDRFRKLADRPRPAPRPERKAPPPPEARKPPQLRPKCDPGQMTVAEIKALNGDLSKSDWLLILAAEREGKNRKGAIAHCEAMAEGKAD